MGVPLTKISHRSSLTSILKIRQAPFAYDRERIDLHTDISVLAARSPITIDHAY